MLFNRLKHFFYYLIITAVTSACLMRTTQATIEIDNLVKTDTPSVALKNLLSSSEHTKDDTEKKLVILDIDDTIISSPEYTWLTSSALFYELLNHYSKTYKIDPVKCGILLDPLLTATCEFIMPILTDKKLPKLIKQYQEDPNIILLMMTSRGLGLQDVTINQLEHVGIFLENTVDQLQSFSIDDKPFTKKSNLVMASHGNTKGDVLLFLIKYNKISSNLSHVVMVDDKIKHLDTVQAALESHDKIKRYSSVHCTYPEKKGSCSLETAKEQLIKFIKKYKTEKTLQKLIDSDRFTKDFIKEQEIEI